MRHYEDDLRRKKPGRAARADSGKSPTSAIYMHCESCSGGQPALCDIYRCFLWPYRIKGQNERPDGTVPSAEEYTQITIEKFGVERYTELKNMRVTVGQNTPEQGVDKDD